MALSALSRHCNYHVFPSFHGEDVRRGLLSCLLKAFKEKGIDVFIDNDIERSKSIGPELKEAIRGSMISLVLISRNYGSSTWCLDELVEIMKYRDEGIQTTMVVFYEVEPSHVKKQSGHFGAVFEKTCAGKKAEEVEIWRQALQEVAKIAGYDSLKCDSDAVMIETIATDVSNKLNDSSTSNDFDNLVGVETHIMKMDSLLSIESDEEVRMVGIWGPAGIGKTTIARALHRKLSSKFTHTAFIERIKGRFEQNYRDEHAFMLHLQELLLSATLNQKDIKIGNLGVAKARLKNKKVLVVLDDVDELKQLEAMTKNTCWFGRGSRIIITTKDKKLLKAHEINHIYQVGFPSTSEALEILRLSAFRQNSPSFGLKDMVIEVTRLAGNLPLGLSVFGAYLRGMPKDQWKHALPRFRTSLDGKIEKVLRFSYDALCREDQELFLHIACFFKGECIDELVEYLSESRLNVIHGVQVLVDEAFISINDWGHVLVHSLLEQLAKQIVRRQSVSDPGKRQFLVDAQEICDVLEENEGTKTILGIDFDESKITGEFIIDERAFEGMPRLQFLRFRRENAKIVLPQSLKFRAKKLRYLQWERYPLTFIPRDFHPQHLVKLDMQRSRLEKLWEEPLPFPCLKWMDLTGSRNLKKVPNLSSATNLKVLKADICTRLVDISSTGKATGLEELHRYCCTRLVDIPSSIGNATNLKTLNIQACRSLVELPSSIWRLKSLNELLIAGCSKLKYLGSRLKSYPDISAKIRELDTTNTAVEEFSTSITSLSCLRKLRMPNVNLKVFPCVPDSIEMLVFACSVIEEIPPSSIQNLSRLTELSMYSCKKLKVLPTNINLENLSSLDLSYCTQLKTFPEISTSIEYLNMEDTAIKEVPSSIWSWSRLRELNLNGCQNLKVIPPVPDKDCSQNSRRSLGINISGCKNLISLPRCPAFVSFLNASNCESLKSIDGVFNNPETCLNFTNCFKLSQDARKSIEISNYKFALLPGGKLPAYFDHRARGNRLTVNLAQRPLPLFLRFKACLLLLPGLNLEDTNNDGKKVYQSKGGKILSCRVYLVQNDVDIGHGSCEYHLPAVYGFAAHLYFFKSSISLNFPATDVHFSELDFEFKITGKFWKILYCGVQLLEDPGVHVDRGCCENSNNETEYEETGDIMLEQ